MGYDKPIIQTSNPYKREYKTSSNDRTIYYGVVISITDETDGGRIKVKIPELDNRTTNDDLPWSYPLMPKFFHVYPQVGEMVRIFIENIKFPENGRYWIGSIISQPQKIGFDSKFTALSTTNLGLTVPENAPSTYPDADGIYPTKDDVALVGKVNTDIILRPNEVQIRAGKHENNEPLKFNSKNPATINMNFEPINANYYSSTIIQSDKIALITHSGNPNFKAVKLTPEDRLNIFNTGHPIARADVLIEALKVIINALVGHIHGYSGIAPEKTEIIKSLENLQLELIAQKNIVTN